MGFNRATQYDGRAGRLGSANWIADLESLIYLESGAQISAADFPNGCPSGTVVHITGNVVKPGPSSDGTVTGLARYDYLPNLSSVGSSNTMAVVVGGVVHVDRLPVMPGAADLPATFVKQNDSGKAFGPGITPATAVVAVDGGTGAGAGGATALTDGQMVNAAAGQSIPVTVSDGQTANVTVTP